MKIFIGNASMHSEIISRIIQTAFVDQATLLQLTPEQYPNFVGFETPERTYGRLTNGDIALLAQWENNIIGTVSYQPLTEKAGVGYIKRLAILPGFRGCNRGELLMYQAEESLRKAGAIRAEISIVAEFSRLQAYYHHLGYQDGLLTQVPSLPFPIQYLYKRLY